MASPPGSRPHSHSMAMPASATSAAKNHPPSQVAPMATGSITAADRMRILRPLFFGGVLASLTAAAIAPVAALELSHGGGEILRFEIGPQLVDENQFAVS